MYPNIQIRTIRWNLAWVLWAVFLPQLAADATVSSVRVFTEPAGAQFTVDGQTYSGQAVFLWPAGSKHFLAAATVQTQAQLNAQYVLAQWQTNLGTPSSVSPITADPGLTYVKAVFTLNYAVLLRYFSCGTNTTDCAQNSPGKVCIGSACYTQDTQVYLPAGSPVTLQAYPSTGYIFTGWMVPGAQVGNTFLTSFVLNQGVTVTPGFQNARPLAISIDTSPSGLQLLIDRAPMLTPANVEWGWNTQHAVGAAAAQRDGQHNLWIFDSWSDGGAINHTYTVAPGSTPVALVARFVPGATATFLTSPTGLALSIDGRTNWPSYNFSWAQGSVHTVAAAAEQTDGQGHRYRFHSWSNGAAPTQQVTVANPPADFRMTASYDPIAQIVVATSPSGLTLKVDGTDCTTPCTVERVPGAQVQVSAAASAPVADGIRLDFTGWSDGAGASRTVTATADPLTVTANYKYSTRLSLVADPPDGALVTVQPGSADGYYDTQAQVVISATARPGYRFLRWEGDLTGVALSGTVSMQSPRTVRAVLEAVPYVSDAAVENGAGQTPVNAVAPGSVVSVFGVHLAPWAETGPPSPLAQTLANITVRLEDRLLPLFFVADGQINLQLPSDVAPGPQALTVTQQGKPPVQAKFTVARNAPGLFSWSKDGAALAVAVRDDGTPVTPDAPAHASERVTVYGTGFGPYDRAAADGFVLPASPIYTLTDAIVLTVGGNPLVVDWAGGISGQVGLAGVRFILGADVGGKGNLPVQINVGGADSNQVLLPVE